MPAALVPQIALHAGCDLAKCKVAALDEPAAIEAHIRKTRSFQRLKPHFSPLASFKL
jgi:hypothetical protein